MKKNWRIEVYENALNLVDDDEKITMNLKSYYKKCIRLIKYGEKISKIDGVEKNDKL